MTPKAILALIDGSPLSEATLDTAVSIAGVLDDNRAGSRR